MPTRNIVYLVVFFPVKYKKGAIKREKQKGRKGERDRKRM